MLLKSLQFSSKRPSKPSISVFGACPLGSWKTIFCHLNYKYNLKKIHKRPPATQFDFDRFFFLIPIEPAKYRIKAMCLYC
jgi:hypothetical protein